MQVIVWILSYAVGFFLTRLTLFAVRFAILGVGAVGGRLFIGPETPGMETALGARPSVRILAAPLWCISLLTSVGFGFLMLWTLWAIVAGLGWRSLLLLVSPVAWLYFTILMAIVRLSAGSSSTAWVVMTHGLGRLRGSVFLLAASLAITIVFALVHDLIAPIRQEGNMIILRMVFSW